jgi:reductive dehalogenase
MLRLFSNRDRPPYLGPYPWERLPRADRIPDYRGADYEPPEIIDANNSRSVANALPRFFDFYRSIRDGKIREAEAVIPSDPEERSRHLKSFCYYLDASQVGVCKITPQARLASPVRIDFGSLEASAGEAEQIRHDALVHDGASYWDEPEGAAAQDVGIASQGHTFALAISVEYAREPERGTPGAASILGSQSARAAVRAAELAVVLAMYIRRLGWSARAHLATATELDPNYVMLAAGLAEVSHSGNGIGNPYLGTRFGVAIVSTSLELSVDRPLAERSSLFPARGLGYWLGSGGTKPGWKRISGESRAVHRGTYPMEKVKRVDKPTTFIDAASVERVPKRADFFSRGAFGDLGVVAERESIDGHFMEKEPIGAALGVVVSEGVPLQFGEPAATKAPGTDNAAANAEELKALCHFLGADIVGITPAYEHCWYSHHFDGTPIEPYHANAIVLVLDQSQETMSGSSGDDWISNAQSFRSYTRSAFLANVVAEHIRGLGWPARSHTAWDEDVLHIPLCIHAGIGELSRIGETVLNPFLGPRFKDAIVTTDLPLTPDRYLDFGLQDFCGQCNKCARECPCDAIPFGDKILFNGYEIWKPDVQRCATYRITNQGGSVCGRCMATCPYQTESTLFNRMLMWAGVHLPFTRSWLVKFDDQRGNGEMNPIKKWWWDLEERDGVMGPAKKVNARPLFFKPRIEGKKAKQVAVYPPHLNPPPDATEAVPVDRPAGIIAQQQCAEDLHRLKADIGS